MDRDRRAAIFDSGELDLKDFQPNQAPPQAPPEAVRTVAEKLNFPSREPAPKPAKKADRRHRTGRNRTLAAKVTEHTERLLYEIYDAHRENEKWTLGEIIGMALETFQKELKGRDA